MKGKSILFVFLLWRVRTEDNTEKVVKIYCSLTSIARDLSSDENIALSWQLRVVLQQCSRQAYHFYSSSANTEHFLNWFVPAAVYRNTILQNLGLE